MKLSVKYETSIVRTNVWNEIVKYDYLKRTQSCCINGIFTLNLCETTLFCSKYVQAYRKLTVFGNFFYVEYSIIYMILF